ncbi:hypothetical protein Lal_00042632 [Lupinus albus]|nr:hypothetical protein Lal_00042632 [Lupinus albus]
MDYRVLCLPEVVVDYRVSCLPKVVVDYRVLCLPEVVVNYRVLCLPDVVVDYRVLFLPEVVVDYHVLWTYLKWMYEDDLAADEVVTPIVNSPRNFSPQRNHIQGKGKGKMFEDNYRPYAAPTGYRGRNYQGSRPSAVPSGVASTPLLITPKERGSIQDRGSILKTSQIIKYATLRKEHLQEDIGNGCVKFNGLNYADWSEQIQFSLGVMELDLTIIMDNESTITETSSEAYKTLYDASLLVSPSPPPTLGSLLKLLLASTQAKTKKIAFSSLFSQNSIPFLRIRKLRVLGCILDNSRLSERLSVLERVFWAFCEILA